MVGYEPDLNPVVDWEKEWKKYMSKDKPTIPKISDATISRPLIRSGFTRDFEATPNIEDECYETSVTPLVQVFSVCISTNFDDGKPCEIYGSIRALEGPVPRFDLYDRDPDDSETVWKDGTLSLIGPVDGAIIPSLSTSLDFCVKERIRGVEVVKGSLSLDPVSEDSYDRLLRGVVQGVHGDVYVYYVIFQFAVYATVQVLVTENENVDKNCKAADIYGSIVTGYENGRKYCSGDEEVKGLETRFFDKPANQPLRVVLGTPMGLSRNVVVVPAYTSLTIDVNLWDSNGKIAGGSLLFPAHLGSDSSQYIRTQNACVEVRVRWCHAYFYLLKGSKEEYWSQDIYVIECEEMQKNPKDKQCSTSSVPRSITSTSSQARYCGRDKVEVFTVFIGGITEKIHALCGTIIVDDGADKFSIYKRDESSCELLPDHGLAGIEVNYRAIDNSEFSITLNLRDPIRNLEVSRGYLGWSVGRTEGNNMVWYEKRVCTVIRGKDGFAAVHYTIFDSAFEAFVEIKLFASGDSDHPIHLYGSLIASYSGCDYSTSYQKKYYRSRLFDRPRDKSLELKTGFKIDLVKSMVKSIVAVPFKHSLIIEADLSTVGIDGVVETISGKTDFEIDFLTRVTRIIQGKHYRIEVFVKFGK
ncbi:hypothetical protein RND81_04G149400 [Saponaria officinalis]|uniref:DUF6598 domain-containing protein n=1 Tax=Saponaria officinalis TaxID=3572 RepID=A0AAW1LEB8_SAPOF